MAKLEDLKGTRATSRFHRYFSEDFKRKKVNELDKKITTIRDICREYEVSSTSVYKWIYKYSLMRKKGVKTVVEADSDTARIKALKDHIAALEQLLGKKQFEIAFLTKQLDITSELYGTDVKKKLSGKHSSGSGKTDTSTPSK
jgi:transposase